MLIEAFRLLGGLLDPLKLLEILVLLTGLAVVLRRWRLALPLQAATVALIIFFGILPGGSWLALPLETRFPTNPSLPSQIAGIIAVGFIEVTHAREQQCFGILGLELQILRDQR